MTEYTGILKEDPKDEEESLVADETNTAEQEAITKARAEQATRSLMHLAQKEQGIDGKGEIREAWARNRLNQTVNNPQIRKLLQDFLGC